MTIYEYDVITNLILSNIHIAIAESGMVDKNIGYCRWDEFTKLLIVSFENTLSDNDKLLLDDIVLNCSDELLNDEECSATKSIVTVGIVGADYDNFDDAIDYLRTINGGTIVVISNMTITSTAIKDITNITIEGDLFFSGMRQINKTVSSGYWYGKNVIFKDIVLFRMSDTGANELFRFTEDYQDVTLKQVTYVGLSAMGSPAAFNCNGKESHIVANYICGLGNVDWGAMAFSNVATLVLQLRNRTSVYLTGEVDACWYDGSCKIEGNPTWNTPDHPILTDKEQLLAKNSINGTFTTVDGKTITIVDGQIVSII